jgi:hypothetical protein
MRLQYYFVRVGKLGYSADMNTTKPPPKQERLPQAPRTPLPELAEFLAPLRNGIKLSKDSFSILGKAQAMGSRTFFPCELTTCPLPRGIGLQQVLQGR